MRPSADRSTPFVEGDAVALLELDGGLGTTGYAHLIEATRGVVLLVVRTSAGDVATACGDFYDAVMDDRLRHRGQGALDAVVAGAGTRPNGDAWAWGR